MALGASIANPSRVWVGLKDGLAAMRREGGRWVDEGNLSGVSAEIRSILETDDGALWLGTGIQGVLRVRFPSGWQPGRPVAVDHFGVAEGLPELKNNAVFELHGEALIATRGGIYRFDFAAASYDIREANRFQVYLEGFDRDWSAWRAETWTQYANLWEGDYRFRVRARNVYGTLSEEAVYAFSILPPWYRTWWIGKGR